MLRAVSSACRQTVRTFYKTASVTSEANTITTKQEVDELFSEKPQNQSQRRHAFSKNRIELIGGVANDPVFKVGQNNRPFLIVNVITNDRIRIAEGYKDITERHAVSVFGNRAEGLSKTIKKGCRLLVEGRLHYSGGQLGEDGERSPRQAHIHASEIRILSNPRSEFQD